MSNHHIENDGISVAVPKNLVRAVRRFIQDYPEVNDLIASSEEATDETIARFIVDVVDEWNATPPIIHPMLDPANVGLNPNLMGIRTQIVNAASARTLKSAMIRMARNDMPYTAGNVTVQTNAVWRNLQPILQDLEIQYKQFRLDYKVAQNISGAWGVAHSDFLMATYQTGRDGFIVVSL